jgi:DNA repair protein
MSNVVITEVIAEKIRLSKERAIQRRKAREEVLRNGLSTNSRVGIKSSPLSEGKNNTLSDEKLPNGDMILPRYDIHCEAHCDLCGETEVDELYFKSFDENVCRHCKLKNQAYEFINKSDAMSQYCLSEGSMKVMKFITRENPRQSSWTPMKLYIRKHVEAQALKRWGTWNELENEITRRKNEKNAREKLKVNMEIIKFRSLDELHNPKTVKEEIDEDVMERNTTYDKYEDVEKGYTQYGTNSRLQSRDKKSKGKRKRASLIDLVPVITGKR